MTLDELLAQAAELPQVPLASTTAYKYHQLAMTQYVDDKLSSMPAIQAIIGNNPLQVMFDNHKHHPAFMVIVFSLGNYELLGKTIPWVYRAYHTHQFSYDYFPIELSAWIEAISTSLDQNITGEILTIYEWMIKHHEQFIALSQSELPVPMPISADCLQLKSEFQSALLVGDHHRCMELAEQYIITPLDIQPFYLQIIQPVLYDIGMLWEMGKISVAEEHLASAIVGRVMANINMKTKAVKPYKGKAVVTASPNEFHEIGAWMVADVLTVNGWQVRYLGANTPQDDLLQMLLAFLPNMLAISVTMAFNIDKVQDLIQAIRNNTHLQQLKIMVGGRICNEIPQLWHELHADGFAINIAELKNVTQSWES